MDTNLQSAPPQGDNAATAQPVVNQVAQTPAPADNVEITPEKREELSRKLDASKEEALRLKAENEQLAREKADLEASIAQRQQSTNEPVQVNEQDVAYFRELGKKAGFAFAPDVEAIKQQSYKEKQQVAFENFMAKHPELNKKGDPQSDKLWNVFQSKLAWFQPPSNPTEWGDRFEDAYRITTWSEQQALERGKALGYAQANIANNSQLGSGSLGGSSAPRAQNLSPERQAVSEGFASVVPHYYKR